MSGCSHDEAEEPRVEPNSGGHLVDIDAIRSSDAYRLVVGRLDTRFRQLKADANRYAKIRSDAAADIAALSHYLAPEKLQKLRGRHLEALSGWSGRW